MKNSIRDEIACKGFSFCSSYHRNLSAEAIAHELGEPIAPFEDRLVQYLVPRFNATPNTYSGIYGLNRFPFHTDLAHWRLPPRFLLLRCLRGYRGVPTQLVDGHALIKAVGLDILSRAIFEPRRPRQGKLELLHLYEPVSGCFRWDEVFLKPGSRIGDLAALRVRNWLSQRMPQSIVLEKIGDTLVVDNWRMLHARSPIPAECQNRKIERVYLGDLH